MKLKCSKEKLNMCVLLADRITSKNTTLPVLSLVLLIAENNKLKIRATNLDTGVEFEIPSIVEVSGVVAVPGNILNNTLSFINNDNDLQIETLNDNLKISTKNNTVVIKTQPYEDFPTLPKIQNGYSFNINPSKIIDGIKSVHYSSSVSDIKPEISSVFIYSDTNTIFFTATDSFRLAEKKITNKTKKEIDGVIIPLKNINEIIKILEHINSEVNIIYNKNQISFLCDGVYLTSRIINGVFPDYKQIIPNEKDVKTNVIILKQDMIDSLKLINVFSDKFNKVNIKINKKEKTLTISSKNDFGENTTNIQSTIRGDSVDMNFNSKYIMDCFQSISGDSIEVSFSEENKPMVIKSVGDNSFLYLVMPINK